MGISSLLSLLSYFISFHSSLNGAISMITKLSMIHKFMKVEASF